MMEEKNSLRAGMLNRLKKNFQKNLPLKINLLQKEKKVLRKSQFSAILFRRIYMKIKAQDVNAPTEKEKIKILTPKKKNRNVFH